MVQQAKKRLRNPKFTKRKGKLLAIFAVFPYDDRENKRKGLKIFMTFGEKLSLLRKENNYTQEQLAELLQVSRQSISKWESNLARPETDRLIQMGKLFSCSMDYLLNDETTQRQPGPVQPEPQAEQAPNNGLAVTIHYNGRSLQRMLPEKKSKKLIFGLPLYHIGRNAHGFFALGLKARGVFSLGLMSSGVFSFGVLSLGLFSAGAFAFGGIAMGAFSLGLLAIGAICLGLVAIGAISIGCFSLGAVAIGKYLAVGDHARAMIAIGRTEALGSLYSHIGSLAADEFQQVKTLLDTHIPSVFSFLLPFVKSWL